MSADSSYLPLCVHLQYVHHVDHDVLVGFLVLPDSERHSEPAGSARTHVGLTAVLPPLTHLEHMIQKDTILFLNSKGIHSMPELIGHLHKGIIKAFMV